MVHGKQPTKIYLASGSLHGGDEATNAAITAGTVVLPQSVTATSDADGNFNFGDITFNEKGTYKFTVSEVVPGRGSTRFRELPIMQRRLRLSLMLRIMMTEH